MSGHGKNLGSGGAPQSFDSAWRAGTPSKHPLPTLTSSTKQGERMFSKQQKIQIADAVEKVLLSFNHPEMPKERVIFRLRVGGKESWSWADIEPNWSFENKQPSINPWNELQAQPRPREE